MKIPAKIYKRGFYTNVEGKREVASCSHCERMGVDVVLFGEQEPSYEWLCAFVCEDCLAEALTNIRGERKVET